MNFAAAPPRPSAIRRLADHATVRFSMWFARFSMLGEVNFAFKMMNFVLEWWFFVCLKGDTKQFAFNGSYYGPQFEPVGG